MPKRGRIPVFKNYEEMGEFWDTHSLADYWDQTEPAKFKIPKTGSLRKKRSRKDKIMPEQIDYRQALMDETKDVPDEAWPNLLQIVRLFKESVLVQSRQAALELQTEFAQWDRLSDEALEQFEKELE